MLFVESEVDKRGKLYKAVSKKGSVVEFTAQNEQTLTRWILGILKTEGKMITSGAMKQFLEKTGTDMERIRQELEKLRRMKTQARLTALYAPLGVKKNADTSAQYGRQATMAQGEQRRDSTLDVSRALSAMRENGYDPAADKDKEAFFNRAEKDASWILPHSRTAGQPLELKTGTIIPGLMVTGINSDLPGNIIAQVSQNVFDTATGRQLLIPQGAKLLGVYDSRVIYG